MLNAAAMPVVALYGQLRPPLAPFALHHYASHWWASLREVFPFVLSAVVLPDRFGVVARVTDPDAVFGALLERAATLGPRLGAVRPVWKPLASPSVARDIPQQREWIGALLQWPRSAGLVGDPMAWRWSTARDLVAAVCDPWLDSHFDPAWMPDWVHRGPPRCSGNAGEQPSLCRVVAAAAAATRSPALAVRERGATRNVAIWLAARHGWSLTETAQVCRSQATDVARIARRPNAAWTDAAERCLFNPRLVDGDVADCVA